ncbi:RNA polymerase sigma factor [Paenibacillus kobensis]|uniref:RNA polymerase sigma factor n=1 Tax=Paenibacillus kobensis TaxID=59841 RepID=UPI0013E2AF28|nr:sigma-70 family RNA polymerase sigma factor [Paenibacillus kobensis]
MDDIITIVMKAQEGSKDDFVRMIRKFEKTMYRVAFGILRSDEDAADAIQETIVAAYRQIRQLREPRYAQTWLVRILINQCNGMRKRNERVVALYEMDNLYADNDNRTSEDKLDLYDAIGVLSAEQREVIMLHYLEDMPLRDIGEMLQLSEGTIKSRLYRAREKLALLLCEPVRGEGLL